MAPKSFPRPQQFLDIVFLEKNGLFYFTVFHGFSYHVFVKQFFNPCTASFPMLMVHVYQLLSPSPFINKN